MQGGFKIMKYIILVMLLIHTHLHTQKHQTDPSIKSHTLYVQHYAKHIKNTTKQPFSKIEQDKQSNPIIYQAYDLDPSIILQYKVLPHKKLSKEYTFPHDFMLEVPNQRLEQGKQKRLDQIAVLGTHNSYTNPIDGFLYFQQQDSMFDQFKYGGIRMLRPAWHHVSGSKIDSPTEPILCHSSPDQCATVSLATRAFKPHKTVQDFNNLVLKLLQEYKDQFLIVGINNYLNSQETDTEFDKIPALKPYIITIKDLEDTKNHAIWGGSWPTIEWMIKQNKRVLYFNDKGSTTYTIDYKKYILKNMFGTSNIITASKRRHQEQTIDNALFEMSWFQNVSLPLHELEALNAGVRLYNQTIQGIPTILAKAFNWPARFFQHSSHQPFYRTFQSFMDIISFIPKKSNIFLQIGLPVSTELIKKVQSTFPNLKKAIHDIMDYVPLKQDNSFETLTKLMQECRVSGVLDIHKTPNIVMLDFATTNGDGMRFVNSLNILTDQKLKLHFENLGGLCINGQLLNLADF